MAIRIYNESNGSVEEALVAARDEGYYVTGLSNGQFEELYGRKSVNVDEHFEFRIGGFVNVSTNRTGSKNQLCKIGLDKMEIGGWIEFVPVTNIA